MGHNLKKGLFFVFFVSFSVLSGAQLVEVNRIVARVNNQVITWGEIELAMKKLNFSEKEIAACSRIR